MKRKFILYFFSSIIIFSGDSLFAQTLENLSNSRLLQKAEDAVFVSDFSTAIDFYEEFLQRKPTNFKTGFALASLYSKIRDYENAMKWYKLLYEQDIERNILALLSFGRMAMASGDVNLAKRSFERFKREFNPDKEKSYIKKLNGFHLDGVLLFETEFDSLKVKYNQVYELDKIYNHPFRTGDQIYFLEDSEEIYLSKNKDDVLSLLNSNIYIPYNFFSPNKEQFFFSKYEQNSKGKYVASIYQCIKRDGLWQNCNKLVAPVNIEGYNSLLPTIGKNSKSNEMVIYFVSDRPEGKGGWDIWYTEFNSKKGVFREPKNLGSKINTAGNEFSPYYDIGEGILYFSSDGWPGFGSYDIFWAKGEARSWEDYFNLGIEVNTNYDEYYFTYFNDAYFWASNRNEHSEALSPHFYDEFFKSSSIRRIREESLTARNEIRKEEGPPEILENDTVYQEIVAKEIPIEEKEDYFIEHDSDSILKITLYHEFDEVELIGRFLTIIDTTIIKMGKQGCLKRVNIFSHTDNFGTDEYNLQLSYKRAKFTNDYMVSKGIENNLIKYWGKGELEPVAPNENIDGTDSPEGRRLNRRTLIEVFVCPLN